MARSLITVPASAKRGEIIEIRALIQHPMETGYRPGSDGKILPRNLIRRFVCRYDDGASNEIVVSAEFFAAVAANPLITFHTVATASGKLSFFWDGDNGFAHVETVSLKVA
jgi:sulfur-oxidizing protein SoxZ